MTKEKFQNIMEKVDEYKENQEYLAGIENAIMDGDTYEQHGEIEIEVKRSLDNCDAVFVEACNQLRVPRQFLDDVLDGCVVNRWELYSSIILRRA